MNRIDPGSTKGPDQNPAALYARRREMELVFDVIKTHQRGRPVLRSQTPDGVRQEIYAHQIVHHATRDLLDEAALLHRTTAERTSEQARTAPLRQTVGPDAVRPAVILPGGRGGPGRRRRRPGGLGAGGRGRREKTPRRAGASGAR
ncbi:hypothetical protein ACIRSD_46745, partial [Streptomyces acidicola]